jgi:hypothetical protein
MAQPREEVSPSRIELVVLACLSQSKPPSDTEIGEAVQQLALPAESVESARRRAVELLACFVRRAWVTGEDDASRRGTQRNGQASRKLTDSGKRVLRNAFNLSRTPTWAQARDRHFASLALGVPPGSDLAAKVCTENAMMAAVLGARFGIRDAFTPMAVCDAIIADALGMPRGKLTLDRMRAHILMRGVDGLAKGVPSTDGKGYAGKLAAWLAACVVGADGTAKKRMGRALARRWVSGEAHPVGVRSDRSEASDAAALRPSPSAAAAAAVASGGDGRAQTAISSGGSPGRSALAEPARNTAGERQSNEPTLARDEGRGTQPTANLLETVREAIPRIGAEGRFGEKVYVSAIWRTIERDRKSGGLSLEKFKSWLVAANRDGWLVLARADLMGAMDAKQVTESEINDRGATFHFVLDQRNGASVSQRESHAR